MEVATPTNRTLDIDGLTGDACVQKVTTALKGTPNVTTQHVKVGSAKINADHAGCKAACASIGNVGFKASEQTHAAQSSHSEHSANLQEQKPVAQSSAPSRVPTAGNAPVSNTPKPAATPV